MNFDFQRLTFAATPPPKFKEARGKGWYMFGERNDFPQLILDLYNNSGLHNAIVTQKAAFIAGKDTEVVLSGTVGEQAGAAAALNRANPTETWQDLKVKCAVDLENFGGYCLQAIWNQPGNRVVAWYHLPFERVRINEDASSVYYCKDWSNRKLWDDAVEMPAFNPDSPGGTQAVYLKQYRAGEGVYPLPDWYPAKTYIEIDTEIASFHYNNIKNGFSIGKILQMFKGQPTEEMKEEINRKFKRNTTGTENAGGIILSFMEKGEDPMQIIDMMPNDFDKMYLQLVETVRDQIFYAHRVTSPMLFGVRVAGELGGRNELLTAYEVFDRAYIQPKREAMDRVFTAMFNASGWKGELKTVAASPAAQDAMDLFTRNVYDLTEVREALNLAPREVVETGPAKQLADSINSLSPLVANTVIKQLTINEIRSLGGLDPVPGGDVPPTDTGADEPVEMSAHCKTCNPFGWDDEKDIEVFSRYGSSADEWEELPELFAELTDPELRVLAVIKDNPKATLEDIAKGARLTAKEAKDVIKDLSDAKKIESASRTIRITDVGRGAIEDSGGIKTEIFVLYKYAKAPGIEGDVIIEGSRDFCRFMVDENKVYTREEIDAISVELGYDVWKRRGGWRTIKGSSPPLHVPQCRHYWESKLYRRTAR
jgi:predicted transcriptional regulator